MQFQIVENNEERNFFKLVINTCVVNGSGQAVDVTKRHFQVFLNSIITIKAFFSPLKESVSFSLSCYKL